MIPFFAYNWQVRDEWFDRLQPVSHEELIRDRTGGVGSILETIFHIVHVEYSWIQAAAGVTVADPDYNEYNQLQLIRQLSDGYRPFIQRFLENRSAEHDLRLVTVPWSTETLYEGEILRHVIAHEIHHMGQLSVWAKELDIKPVSANLINRGLFVQ
ncbi:DinB family protein [Paenibacillus tarimensis]|uniref:DinB family protein n=1 Tax=Paenibacillus tarimensis TaxID=416012 RepID=UPI001F239B32|nr:DinB family protein [Paenibacillus tarimensis]MCF2946078.1 DinB family protein [Paenibacillus tarimensis]